MGMHFKVKGEHNNSCRVLLASLYYEQKDYRKALTLYAGVAQILAHTYQRPYGMRCALHMCVCAHVCITERVGFSPRGGA